MSSVYSTEINIVATVYVRADSAAEALKEAMALKNTEFVLPDGAHLDIGPEISGLSYDDPDLPDVSLSPMMTIQGFAIDPGEFPSADLSEGDGHEDDEDDAKIAAALGIPLPAACPLTPREARLLAALEGVTGIVNAYVEDYEQGLNHGTYIGDDTNRESFNAYEAAQKEMQGVIAAAKAAPVLGRPLDAASARLLAVLEKALPELESEAEQRETSGNDEYYLPMKELAQQARAAIDYAKAGPGPDRSPAAWLERAVTLLAESHTAWEGEEESVKEEHAGLIADLDAFFEDWHADNHRGWTHVVDVSAWTGEDYDETKRAQIAMQDNLSGEIVHVKLSRPGTPAISRDAPSIGIERRGEGWWIGMFPGNSDPAIAFHLGDQDETFTEIDV